MWTIPSPSWTEIELTAFYNTSTVNNRPSVSPWKPTARSLFSMHQFQENKTAQNVHTTSVYRKPTYTDQYLAYDSHHPQSVKRGILKCLYDRAKHLVSEPSVISDEKKHLSSVLVSNRCPYSFVQNISKARIAHRKEFKSTAISPYIQGVSEPLRRCLEQQQH